jgi:hypothetical protein
MIIILDPPRLSSTQLWKATDLGSSLVIWENEFN